MPLNQNITTLTYQYIHILILSIPNRGKLLVIRDSVFTPNEMYPHIPIDNKRVTANRVLHIL